MVKARDILYKVSFYLSLAFAILWAVVCAICLIFGLIGIITGIIAIAADEEGAAAVLAGGIEATFGAICFAVMSVCSFINMGLSKKAPVENTKKTYITSIVFSVLSGTEVGIVGAIFGLILLNQNQQASDDKVVEAEVVEAKTEEAPKEEAKTEEAPQEEAKPEEPAEKTDAE